MNYLDILDCSIADGEGVRVVLFVSGCSHCCKGCHNPESWDPDNGKKFTTEVKEKLFELIDRPYIDGLTLTGGDPLFCGNISEIRLLCLEFKRRFPNKTIWLYTGYELDQIKGLDFLAYVDVIVDGEYKEELRDITLPFRGSSNQRIIYLNNKIE